MTKEFEDWKVEALNDQSGLHVPSKIEYIQELKSRILVLVEEVRRLQMNEVDTQRISDYESRLTASEERLKSAESALAFYAKLYPGRVYPVKDPHDDTEIAREHFARFSIEYMNEDPE